MLEEEFKSGLDSPTFLRPRIDILFVAQQLDSARGQKENPDRGLRQQALIKQG